MAAEGGLMYADGGIADLPAPNMESMDMASGGIVAFDEGGEVPRFNEGGNWFTEMRDSLYSPEERRYEAMKRGRATDEPSDTLSQNQINAVLRGKTPGPAEAPMPPESMQKEIDDSKMRLFKQDMAAKENAANAKPVSVDPIKAQIDALSAKTKTPGAGPSADKGLGATDEFKSYMDMVKKNNADYLSKLEGFGAKTREGLAAIKSQGGGEALMGIAKGILSKPGLAAGISAGLPDVMAASANTRKEQRAVENTANDYDLNLAKAQEAAAKGDMESALMFKKMAQDAKYQQGMLQYHMASLNKPGETMQLLDAIRKPGESMGDAFARYNTMKKGELYSIDKATDDFNKIAADKFSDPAKRLKALGITTPYQYQQYVMNQSGGGGGTDLQAQAIAELARRSKS
jgi:hypothetical protein